MSEYVDRDAVTQMISKWADGHSYIEVPTDWAEDEVRKIPAADVAPVRHGRWIRNSPTAWIWTCSCCQKADVYAYSVGDSLEPVLQDLFCPNCGAKMDGGVEDE